MGTRGGGHHTLMDGSQGGGRTYCQCRQHPEASITISVRQRWGWKTSPGRVMGWFVLK